MIFVKGPGRAQPHNRRLWQALINAKPIAAVRQALNRLTGLRDAGGNSYCCDSAEVLFTDEYAAELEEGSSTRDRVQTYVIQAAGWTDEAGVDGKAVRACFSAESRAVLRSGA